MAQLSNTALAVLSEVDLTATPTGLKGRSGRSYSKRVTDPLFRSGYLTTGLFHLFTKGVKITDKGREAVLATSEVAPLDRAPEEKV